MLRKARSVAIVLTSLSIIAVPLGGCGGEPEEKEAVTVKTSRLVYSGAHQQFTGGFAPTDAPYGGFGGATNCVATKTPVIFVHGNGDVSNNWDYPASTGAPSVYEELKSRGYTDCELFGINYLDPADLSDPSSPAGNYHNRTTANRVGQFISDVVAYTGAAQVDIVAHSMGVTVSLHAIDYRTLWPKIRRFVNIAGAIQGLASCYWMGYANPIAPTCGGQNLFDSEVFGFYPNSWSWSLFRYVNPRMGTGSQSFYRKPSYESAVRFYTISADEHDMVMCSALSLQSGCGERSKFGNYANVKAQLDIGHGTLPVQMDFDFTDYSIYNAWGGDIDGVGHFRSKNNSGRIVYNMLTTTCSGSACCSGYGGACAPF